MRVGDGGVVTGMRSDPDAAEQWLSSAYAAHGRELYGLAHRSLGDPGLAEEAVQDTFTRAWCAADRFDESLGSLRTWLFAILRNIVIDLARARAVRPAVAAEPASDEHGAARVELVDALELDRTLLAW